MKLSENTWGSSSNLIKTLSAWGTTCCKYNDIKKQLSIFRYNSVLIRKPFLKRIKEKQHILTGKRRKIPWTAQISLQLHWLWEHYFFAILLKKEREGEKKNVSKQLIQLETSKNSERMKKQNYLWFSGWIWKEFLCCDEWMVLQM